MSSPLLSDLLSSLYRFNAARMGQLIPPDGFVLDIGSGDAQYLRHFAKQCPDIRALGLDPSGEMVRRGNLALRRDRLRTRVGLEKSELTHFSPPAGENIHLISCVLSLHQFPTLKHVRQCLERIARIREEHGCAVWIFDVTPQEFLEGSGNLPAGLPFEEISQIIDKTYMGLFRHERVRIHHHYFQLHQLESIRNDRPVLRPMRVDLRVAEIGAYDFLGDLWTSPFSRTFALIAMLFRLLGITIVYGLRRLFWGLWDKGNISSALQRRLGKLAARDLGRLKGPLMKLGQIIGSSPSSLLSPIVRKELSSLQDRSAPIDALAARLLVENELGRSIHDVFSEWSPTPFANGVVSQTHFAKLKDGTSVAVKIRYPYLLDVVRSDLQMLRGLQPFLKWVLPVTNPTEIFAEVHTLMLAECDFAREARIQAIFHKIFEKNPNVIIPKVFQQLSTEQMITMEYIDGKRFYDFVAEATQEEKNRAGEIMWQVVGEATMNHCMFNADPHPGNYLFVNGKVCFLDFGFTKRWPVEFIRQSKLMLSAVLENDLESFIKAITQLGFVENKSSLDFKLMLDINRRTFMRPWVKDELFQFTDHFIQHDMNRVVTEWERTRLPPNYIAYMRIFWGYYTILAQLKAEANWHHSFVPILSMPTEAAPTIDSI